MTVTTSLEAALGPAEFAAFSALASEARSRFGAAFTPRGSDRLLAAVRARQARLGLAGLAAYGDALRADSGEWDRLWPLALVDGGGFFQPAPQFEAAGAVLREWAVGAPERTLRVLSVGCGAFETISLAVLLEEAGFRHKNWRVEICGLDLNPEAVAWAEAGFFRPEEVSGLASGRRQKWFTPRAGGLVFKAALAPPIALASGNAYEPETWPWAAYSFDLIFCRGLTFESPPEAPGRLAEILLAALAPDGFVFTAPGEFLPDVSGDFLLEERVGVTWYRRGSRRVKANRFHQPRRAGKEAAPAGSAREAEPEEEALLLVEAERLLASGRPDEARELAGEVMRAFMNRGSSAWAAWAFMGRWAAALGRRPSLSPIQAEAAVGGFF